MRIKLLISAFLLAFCVQPASPQTALDIEQAYGKSVQVYSISENIWMTPEYSSDGRACRMRLYRKRIGPNINYLSSALPFEELKTVLNRLVPPAARGLRNESFGQTATGGPAAWTTYGYENVTFTFVSPFGLSPYDGTVLRKGEFVFTVPPDFDYTPVSRDPTDDDFRRSTNTEIVTISWKDRECERN